ncbi:hypothetical protein BJ165DRAFT_460611 [Panaeolus papilionaceus]|nr:hypothetical protein BJ165DRAFT_460611 [Panaeolus papilionaceus]
MDASFFQAFSRLSFIQLPFLFKILISVGVHPNGLPLVRGLWEGQLDGPCTGCLCLPRSRISLLVPFYSIHQRPFKLSQHHPLPRLSSMLSMCFLAMVFLFPHTFMSSQKKFRHSSHANHPILHTTRKSLNTHSQSPLVITKTRFLHQSLHCLFLSCFGNTFIYSYCVCPFISDLVRMFLFWDLRREGV